MKERRCAMCNVKIEKGKHCSVSCSLRSLSSRTDKYAMVKAHRCPDCGRWINLRECFGCEMERRRDKAREIRNFIKERSESELRRISEEISGVPEHVKGARRKCKEV